MQRLGARSDHQTQPQPPGRDQARSFVDQRSNRSDAAGADHLGAGDQGADPVREIDQLRARDAGKEILVAAGEADDLVWEDRSDHDSHIGLGNMAIDSHLNRGVGQQSASEFAEPVSPDDPQRSEGPGPPGLVVEDGPAGIRVIARPGGVAQVTPQMIFTHALVGAEGDNHLHLLGPLGQGSVRRLQQQGQWAGPGAIRDHETDPLAVQLSLGESRADETTDRLRRKRLSDAANGGRPCWVARICPVVPF
jgi:hypothetical protein